jgi:hypothetical protein
MRDKANDRPVPRGHSRTRAERLREEKRRKGAVTRSGGKWRGSKHPSTMVRYFTRRVPAGTLGVYPR